MLSAENSEHLFLPEMTSKFSRVDFSPEGFSHLSWDCKSRLTSIGGSMDKDTISHIEEISLISHKELSPWALWVHVLLDIGNEFPEETILTLESPHFERTRRDIDEGVGGLLRGRSRDRGSSGSPGRVRKFVIFRLRRTYPGRSTGGCVRTR